MNHLISYATPDMSISAEILKRSAKANGIDKSYLWGRAAIEQTEFYQQNREILDTPRGSGLWAWKAWIILDLMNKLPDGEIIVYSDAGVEFVAPVQNIINRMQDDIWLFGNVWTHSHWCKGDIFKALDNYQDGLQVQASVIIFKNTLKARAFVKTWLKWCCVPQLINDAPSIYPNSQDFRENRHDQAILTTLFYKEYPGAKLHWWPAMYNAGNFIYDRLHYPQSDNYPVMFHHHRRRNNEWTLTDPLNQQITNYFKRKYPGVI